MDTYTYQFPCGNLIVKWDMIDHQTDDDDDDGGVVNGGGSDGVWRTISVYSDERRENIDTLIRNFVSDFVAQVPIDKDYHGAVADYTRRFVRYAVNVCRENCLSRLDVTVDVIPVPDCVDDDDSDDDSFDYEYDVDYYDDFFDYYESYVDDDYDCEEEDLEGEDDDDDDDDSEVAVIKAKPVPKEMVENVLTKEKLKERDDDGGGGGDEECTICCEEMKCGDEVGKMNCRHKFHYSCISKWLLSSNSSCPLCRHNVLFQ